MSHVFSSFTNPSGFSHPFPKKLSESSRLEGQAVGIDLDVLEFPEPEFVMRLYLDVVVLVIFRLKETNKTKNGLGWSVGVGECGENELNQAFHFFWGFHVRFVRVYIWAINFVFYKFFCVSNDLNVIVY